MEATLAILKAIKKHIDRMGADATFNVLDIAIKVCEAMPVCYQEQIALSAFKEEDEC